MINYIRLLLIPFSIIYGIATVLRNFLYNLNLLKVTRVDVPVIAIGNISTGGTGKSPFVIFLAEYFLAHNKKVSIISRGYKSNNNKITIVSDGNKMLCNIDECGDEPFMIAESLMNYRKDFSVIAYKNRIKASKFAIEKFKPDVIILDDTFQHRKIFRDLDIVIIDSYEFLHNKMMNMLLLPAGNLREIYNGLKRADIIIQNNKFNKLNELSKFTKYNRNRLQACYEIVGFLNKNSEKVDIKNKSIIAFAGIAKPDSFFNILEHNNYILKDKITFADHHNYSDNDYKKIIHNYSENDIFVTTEKDFVKIKMNTDFISKYDIYFLKIRLKLDFMEYLEKIINKNIQMN